MKKFFTLIAAVALAASVNAQGTYAVQVGDKVNAGDRITSVKNVTLTYMENAGTAFADGKAVDNWADANFVAYVSGKNSGKLVSGAEPTGCAYKFETTKAGSLTVAVQLNGNKGFHILDADFAEVAPASYNLPSAKDGDVVSKLEIRLQGDDASHIEDNDSITRLDSLSERTRSAVVEVSYVYYFSASSAGYVSSVTFCARKGWSLCQSSSTHKRCCHTC